MGSEPIHAAVLEEFATAFRGNGFRREAFYCCYGMAEATLLVTGSTPGAGPIFETLNADLLSSKVAQPAGQNVLKRLVVVGCGKAARGQELAVVDPELKVRLPDGHVGEIWLRGDNIAQGYWEKPDLSRETFAAEVGNESGFLRTGDLGYLRSGELFVTGRIKDLIIIRGKNHYPQDIERTVDTCHGAVSPDACAAISVTANGEEALAIIVEIQRCMLRSFVADEVFGQIRKAIFEQHELTTNSIVLIRPATLPRTSSGKIQHRECRAQFLRGDLEILATWKDESQWFGDGAMVKPEAGVPAAPGGSDRPDSLAIQIWLKKWISARLSLNPSRIDPDLAFAESGLDSISSVALTTDLSQMLGFEVSSTLVWEYPTIRLASIYLASRNSANDRHHLAPTRPAGTNHPVRLATHVETGESLEDSANALASELAELAGTAGRSRSRKQRP